MPGSKRAVSISKRLVALGVSVALLVVLFRSVPRDELQTAVAASDLLWLTAGLLFFVPQILAIAWRWKLIAQPVADLGLGESIRQVLASNCLNLVLPSKLGDLAKGVFLYRQGHCQLKQGMQVVVFEKLLDLAALSVWMLAGWAFTRRTDWWVLAVIAFGAVLVVAVYSVYFNRAGARLVRSAADGLASRVGKLRKIAEVIGTAPEVARLVHADGGRRRRILAWSLGIWLLHLLQIACFFRAAGAQVAFLEVIALMPIAIFAGLMPLTIGGFGVRDAALVLIFKSPETPRAVLLTAALFVSSRYVVPALAGLPFVSRSFSMAKDAEQAATSP